MSTPAPQHTWTIAEAKAKLSEVLRLAEEEGPQRIGTRKAFFVVPESVWYSREKPGKRKLGGLEGKIKIAPDFDETPQDIVDSFWNSELFPDEGK